MRNTCYHGIYSDVEAEMMRAWLERGGKRPTPHQIAKAASARYRALVGLPDPRKPTTPDPEPRQTPPQAQPRHP